MNKQGVNGIGWCDYTWNPIAGCSPASEGCTNCYAADIAKRFKLPWGNPVLMAGRLGEPERVKKPSVIFVCSMSDLFHEGCERIWQEGIMDRIAECPRHTFILLTKRPQVMQAFFQWNGAAPPNCWIGVTAENQARYDERVPVLMNIPAVVRLVSVEPMLEGIDIEWTEQPDWIIAGPENGSRKRPFKPEWIEALGEQCRWNGIPFFDKRIWGGPGAVREMPGSAP